ASDETSNLAQFSDKSDLASSVTNSRMRLRIENFDSIMRFIGYKEVLNNQKVDLSSDRKSF
ncbi:7596_t:CDS:1, partial [Funneliformis caledonium]